jgi:hypothetical protein
VDRSQEQSSRRILPTAVRALCFCGLMLVYDAVNADVLYLHGVMIACLHDAVNLDEWSRLRHQSAC